MSVKRISDTIQSLQTKKSLHADDLRRLREAAGPEISKAEQALVDTFVHDHGHRLGKKELAQIRDDFALSSSPASREPRATGLRMLEETKIDIHEASGIVEMKGGFLIVDDEKGLYWKAEGQDSEVLLKAKAEKSARGLEGLCLSSDNKSAYMLSEDSRKITKVPLEWKQGTPRAGEPEVLGRLPSLGDTKNKGWEGIDILPGKFSKDGQDRLIAVHEGSPLRVGVFSLPDLEESIILKLPQDAKDQIRDISDIAICPKTGHLFLLSDESSRIIEMAVSTKRQIAPGALLERPELDVLGSFDLDLKKGSKPEGLSFGQNDTLWVVSDGDKRLWQFQIERD